MYTENTIGQDVLLNAGYCRLALDVLRQEDYATPYVLRQIGLTEKDFEAPMVPVEHHYRILEYARGAVKNFKIKMAQRCGINTLGPIIPAILASRCAREAWLVAATYIPVLDRSAQIEMKESTAGAMLEVRHSAMSDANTQDFAYASFHIAASIVAAGLTDVNFKIMADYYNMGDIGDVMDWGDHMQKSDNGPRRLEIFLPGEIADKVWPQSTESGITEAKATLDKMLAQINASPSLKVKIEKAYASAEVRSGKPLGKPQDMANYLNLSVEAINKRLEKDSITLKQIFLEFSTRWAVLLIEDTNKTAEEINNLTFQVSNGSSFARTLKHRTGKTFKEIRGGGKGIGLCK